MLSRRVLGPICQGDSHILIFAASHGLPSLETVGRALVAHAWHQVSRRACEQSRAASSTSSSTRWKNRQGRDSFSREARVQGLKSRAAFKLLEIDQKHRLFKKGQTVVDLGYAPGSWSQVAVERTKPDGRIVGIDIIPAQPPKGVSTIQGNFLSEGVRENVKKFLADPDRGRPRQELHTEQELSTEHGNEAPTTIVGDETSYIDLERQVDDKQGFHGKDSTAKASSNKAKKRSERRDSPGQVVDVVLSDMSAPWEQTEGFWKKSLSNPYYRMMNTSGITFKDHAGSMDLCNAALAFAGETLRTGGHFVCKFYQGAEDKELERQLRSMFKTVHREKPESSRSESKEAYFVALRRKIAIPIKTENSAVQAGWEKHNVPIRTEAPNCFGDGLVETEDPFEVKAIPEVKDHEDKTHLTDEEAVRGDGPVPIVGT